MGLLDVRATPPGVPELASEAAARRCPGRGRRGRGDDGWAPAVSDRGRGLGGAVGWRRLTGRKANWAATSAAALAGLRRGLSGLLLQVAAGCNQKKCTSMNATINSYISLTLF
jgi:hypothetical protein